MLQLNASKLCWTKVFEFSHLQEVQLPSEPKKSAKVNRVKPQSTLESLLMNLPTKNMQFKSCWKQEFFAETTLKASNEELQLNNASKLRRTKVSTTRNRFNSKCKERVESQSTLKSLLMIIYPLQTCNSILASH